MKFMIKWLTQLIITVSLLLYYDVPFLHAALATTALTLITYFVGDQLILRNTSNAVATFMDGVLIFAVLGFASYQLYWDLPLTTLFIASLLLAITEWVLHRFVFRIRLSVSPTRNG